MSIIKPHLLAMSPYRPPLESRNANTHLLLDFNERTIPVSEPVVNALKAFLAEGRLQQYPVYSDIVEQLADYAGVTVAELMITNGSDQGIDLVFRATARPGAEAIIPGPSFAIYSQCAKVEAMILIEPQYTRTEGYPVQQVVAAINPNTAIIVIANPNNPSGTLVEQEAVEKIARAAPRAAILVDECYYEYSHTSCISLLEQFPNLFITRTFSKTWGIPSLRFGYLMAAPDYIQALCNIRGPYDVNQLAVVAAKAALENPDYTKQYVNEVMTRSKPLLEQWLDRQGTDYWPSGANYLWVFPEHAEALANYFARQNILVRPKACDDRLGLRITTGTCEQTQRLLDVWSQFDR